MKKENRLFFITGGLALAAAIVMLTDYFPRKHPGHEQMASLELVTSAALAPVAKVEISRAEQRIDLEKQSSGFWYVKSSDGSLLPADAKKIAKLFDDILQTKKERFIGDQVDDQSYGLDHPTLINLGEAGSVILLSLGDSRNGGGQFVRSGRSVFLVDKQIETQIDLSHWESKLLIAIPPTELQKISFQMKGKPQLVLLREKAEDKLTIEGAVQEFKYKEGEQEAASKLFEALEFQNRIVRDNVEAKSALKDAVGEIAVQRFDGRSYQFKLGKFVNKDQEKYFIEGIAPPSVEKSDDKIYADTLQDSVFEVASYVAKKLLKEKTDFEMK